MKLATTYLLLLAIAAINVVAEDQPVPNGTIYGHVYDADSKDPLQGAFVYYIDVQGPKIATNTEGYFAIKGSSSPALSYTIRCIKFGYDSSDITVRTDQVGSARADFYIKKTQSKPKENGVPKTQSFSSPPETYKPSGLNDYQRGVTDGLRASLVMGRFMGAAIYDSTYVGKYNAMVDPFNQGLIRIFGNNQTAIQMFWLSPIEKSWNQSSQPTKPVHSIDGSWNQSAITVS